HGHRGQRQRARQRAEPALLHDPARHADRIDEHGRRERDDGEPHEQAHPGAGGQHHGPLQALRLHGRTDAAPARLATSCIPTAIPSSTSDTAAASPTSPASTSPSTYTLATSVSRGRLPEITAMA